MRTLLSALLAVAACTCCSAQPDAATIISRSVEANAADWNAAPEYNYFDRVRTESGTKTYHVMMIDGSPYQELVDVNGRPLPPEQQQREQHKLEEATAQRNAESPDERSERIAKYQRGRTRDHLLMQELTRAFDFKLLGEHRLEHYSVYVLQAQPRAGYRPPNTETEVLTGMQGKLWIDTETYQWVRVKAEVVHPVSIAGFLAVVQPGTRFLLEKTPVANGIWLPKHFVMRASAKILFLFHHQSQDNETFFNYQKAGASPLETSRFNAANSGRPPAQ